MEVSGPPSLATKLPHPQKPLTFLYTEVLSDAYNYKGCPHPVLQHASNLLDTSLIIAYPRGHLKTP